MTKVRFGRTGLEVSVVGFGGASIGILEVEQERAAGVLNLLLDSGVNLIDTAAGYAGSEEMIGRAEEVWPEEALRFTLSQAGVHCAIIGATRPENAKRNIEYAGKGALAEGVVGKIREAFRRAEATAGSKWVGQI